MIENENGLMTIGGEGRTRRRRRRREGMRMVRCKRVLVEREKKKKGAKEC
jgi:hypothetical protein